LLQHCYNRLNGSQAVSLIDGNRISKAPSLLSWDCRWTFCTKAICTWKRI